MDEIAQEQLVENVADAGRAQHWQKGFFDHLLRSDESAAEKWEYVRENPVRAGLAARVGDWPYAGEVFELDCRVERH